MSYNLEYVLYGKLNSTDEEKEEDAYQFAKKYRNDIQGFLTYIKESNFAVGSNYKESWDILQRGYIRWKDI